MSLLTATSPKSIAVPFVGTVSHTAREYVTLWESPRSFSEKVAVFSEVTSMNEPKITRFMLSGRIATNWVLRQPISLAIAPYDPGGYLVSDDIVFIYGMGETQSKAIDEYKSMLLDLFEELTLSENVLSSNLQEQLDYLRSIIAQG